MQLKFWFSRVTTNYSETYYWEPYLHFHNYSNMINYIPSLLHLISYNLWLDNTALASVGKIRKKMNTSSKTFSMTHVYFTVSGFDSWYISNNMTLVKKKSFLFLLSAKKEENKSILCMYFGRVKKRSFLSVYKSRLLFSFSGRFRSPTLPLAHFFRNLTSNSQSVVFFLEIGYPK